jgi:dihydropteroate synthase
VSDRVNASLAAAVLAVVKGARILRVHDVKATREAVAVYNAISN